ncbi:LysR family transcriptional regulator [Falsiroseomonas sp. HW251]|uniref:LysR family transcriptional regulator n=1 Tax=Falsiroseomonas sp. HW251 TaxID=3390998 RepID=UPI003D316298
MNLRQLRYFVRVIELGSITRAAEALHVAQPALGLQVKQLEDGLGVQLLARHSRGVEATPAGRLLFDRARAILRQVDDTQRDVMGFGKRVRETLSLGLSPSLVALLGPDLVQRARTELPDLELRLVEELSFTLAEWVEAGRLDLALAYDPPEREGVTAEPVLEEALVLVRPAAGGVAPEITMVEVLAGELALPGRVDSISRTLASEAARRGVPLRIAFEVQSVAAIKRLVARGLATAVLPRGVVADEVARGELSASRVTEPPIVRRLALLSRPDRAAMRQEPQLRTMLFDMARRSVPQA